MPSSPLNDEGPKKSRRRRGPRVRPASQRAQVIVRTSEDAREELHALARAAGYEATGTYLLDLAAQDAARRGADARALTSSNVPNSAESPDPTGDRGSHAKAGSSMAVDAG